jgi:TPR repeat protein
MKNMKKVLAAVMVIGMGSMFVLHTMNPNDRPKDLLDQADDLLYPPTGEKADYQRGRELLERVAAQQDDPFSSAYAKQDLADIYKDGLGVEQDEQKGRTYFDEALSAYEQLAANAERNPKAAASANYELGHIYEGDDYDSDDDKSDSGKSDVSDWVEPDADKSHAYFQQASVLLEQVIEQYADLESIGEASLMLGHIYGAGHLGNPDYEKARMFYENVAYNKQMPIKLGMDACSELASFYQYGRGENALGKDMAKAIKVYTHMATLAERSGKKEYIYQARMRLGDAYAYGDPADYVKARQEYEKIAEWPDALLALAWLYRNGQGGTFPKDVNLAEKYMKAVLANADATESQKKIADQELADIWSSLAFAYYYGSPEIPINYPLASEYAHKVLAHEGAQSLPQQTAHFILGKMSYEGHGTEKNYIEASDHFNKAIALTGDNPNWMVAESQLDLGKIYYYGQEGMIEPDYKKAFDHFMHVIENKVASEWDKAAAQAYAGRMYYRGQGTAQNYVQAARFTENALENANLPFKERIIARYTLGMMYYYGHVVPVDVDKAREFFDSIVHNENTDPADRVSAQDMIGLIQAIQNTNGLERGPRS